MSLTLFRPRRRARVVSPGAYVAAALIILACLAGIVGGLTHL